MRIARFELGDQIVYGEVLDDEVRVCTGDVLSGVTPTDQRLPAATAAFLAPVEPRRIFVVLGGFRKEGATLPPGERPVLISKVVSSVTGDGGQISVPPFVGPIWIEVELAVVIGRELYRASPEQVADAILGYTCFNDACAPEFIRDLETQTALARPDYFRCKSIETFASMGPWIRTDLEELEIAAGLSLTAWRNGEMVANGNTRNAKFLPSEVVRHVAEQIRLYPGDVISLGTPQPFEARPGDEVTLEVEGIGSFKNTVVRAS